MLKFEAFVDFKNNLCVTLSNSDLRMHDFINLRFNFSQSDIEQYSYKSHKIKQNKIKIKQTSRNLKGINNGCFLFHSF